MLDSKMPGSMISIAIGGAAFRGIRSQFDLSSSWFVERKNARNTLNADLYSLSGRHLCSVPNDMHTHKYDMMPTYRNVYFIFFRPSATKLYA